MRMTAQEMYNKAEAHLIQQGCRALSESSGNCMYLDEKGRKCSVGAFIPEGHPAQLFSGSVQDLVRSYPDLKEVVGVSSYGDEQFLGPLFDKGDFVFGSEGFVFGIQLLHDMESNWPGIQAACEKFAIKWGLTP